MGKAGQQQHVELHRKLAIRRELLQHALPGPAYVPFVGDGDIASELYQDRECYAADIDPVRVATASARLANSHVIEADCDGWPFSGCEAAFSIADLDSYSNPYKSLVAFWQNAQKAERVVIFGTDSLRLRINRVSRRFLTLPEGSEQDATSAQAREQYNFWWPKYVVPFVEQTIAPYTITANMKYLRNHMLYWGIVADKPGGNLPAIGAIVESGDSDQVTAELGESTEKKRRKPYKFTEGRRKRFLDLIHQGIRRAAAADQVGISRWTYTHTYRTDPAFAEQMDAAEAILNEDVEDALLEAARSGNVRAIEVWLYNRSPERWSDRRKLDASLHGPSNGPIPIDLTILTDEELNVLERLAERLDTGEPA